MRYFTYFVFMLGIIVNINAETFSIEFNNFAKYQSVQGMNNSTQNIYQIDSNIIKSMIQSKEFTIRSFPIKSNEYANIQIKKTPNIIDKNAQFYIGNTKTPFPKVILYEGYIENKHDSKVLITIINNIIAIVIDYQNETTYFFPSIKDNNIYLLSHTSEMQIPGKINENDTPEDLQFINILKQKMKYNDKLQSNGLTRIDLAYEADSEVFKACGSNIDKTQAYIITLLTKVSRIFEQFIDVEINITWLKIWTNNPSDPYNAKGDFTILRDKALVYWDNQYKDVNRDLYHVSTSISYGGGGFGYLNVLCNDKYYSMSVSSIQCSNDLSTFNFAYDVYITAHELGHNLNAQHTHSCFWNNAPLDTCVVDSECLPPDMSPKPSPGSIMSYCGGINNAFGLGYQVRMIFRPENIQMMKDCISNAQCLHKIETPFIRLVQPLDKQTFYNSEFINIEWKAYNIDLINIYYSVNSGKDWKEIATNINANDQNYKWYYGDICSNKVKIKVAYSSDTSINNINIADFIIKTNDPDKLVAYYPLDSNSNDEQLCHFYNADNINNVEYTYDRNNQKNKCVKFTGNNFLKVNDFNSTFDELTISFWINLSNLDGNQHIVGTNWQEGWSFSTYYWGQLGVSFYINGKGAPEQVWAGSLQKNKWYNIAITFDSINAKIYIDGILKSNRVWDNNAQLNNFANTPLYIGSRNNQEFLSGDLDELKIYNRVLTPEEILKITDIKDFKEPLNLTIYPNPIEDILLINNLINNISYQIYTISGILTKEGSTNGTIDVANLNRGVYILKIENKQFKFVKI